ncbi:Cys-tRNA(Pro) deacylase [Microlunatus antarcticus]|uniref:Cys-tRNA(Pro)/Cys-tRNA(Cys) deacylase n=1 Tax=Microlunatus antarcticus TaxID=53388 RepID=A0A7W5JX32_9ACTN|nr:Cys-tRNA(Pro)/Cys-tRNA(Cys) deacylase [Microlunatus antarcticus]
MARRRDAQQNTSGGTPATAALTRAGVAFTLHPYEHVDGERHFGDEATAALGLDPARVFKTLVADLGGERSALAVAVVPVARQLDLKAFAGALGAKKAAMADAVAAQRSSGYVLGGISPLGQRTALPTVVDATALTFPTVFVSAGRRGLQVELSPADLVAVTRAQVAAVGH